MNKIYKVVWSKAKHCYVVTSELAKRQTKGCGARSLRMAAVSLGVAAALIGGVSTPVAEAAPIAARTQETVTVVKIDCSKAYTFQSANNPLAVDAALIATVPNGNRVYGNVAKGKEKNIDVVTYTVIDEVLVKDIKRSIEYGDEYVSVLTVNPFNDTTATGDPTYPTLGEYYGFRGQINCFGNPCGQAEGHGANRGSGENRLCHALHPGAGL